MKPGVNCNLRSYGTQTQRCAQWERAARDILVALNDLRDGRFRLSLYHTDEELKHWQQLSVLDQSAVATENVDLKLFEQGVEKKYMTVAQGDVGQESRLKALMHEVKQRAWRIRL